MPISRRLVNSAERPSRLRGLLAQLAPRWFAASSPRATAEIIATPIDSGDELAHPVPTTSAAVHVQDGSSRPLLRMLASLGAFTSSAALVAWAFRSWYQGPMLPREVLGVGTIGWLAAGALAHLWRRRPLADLSEKELSPRLDYVLCWIGLLWAALALL